MSSWMIPMRVAAAVGSAWSGDCDLHNYEGCQVRQNCSWDRSRLRGSLEDRTLRRVDGVSGCAHHRGTVDPFRLNHFPLHGGQSSHRSFYARHLFPFHSFLCVKKTLRGGNKTNDSLPLRLSVFSPPKSRGFRCFTAIVFYRHPITVVSLDFPSIADSSDFCDFEFG